MSNFNILLSSVGRRPYLVEWFQEALSANHLHGQVFAADIDPFSPVRAFTDGFIQAPRVNDPNYQHWLMTTLSEYDISLAISVNDFELSEWAVLPREEKFSALLRLSSKMQLCVEDKFAMHTRLIDFGVMAPRTWLGGNLDLSALNGENFLTKGRFGSASRGLIFTDRQEILSAIDRATLEVTTRQGFPALQQDDIRAEDLVIVQEKIDGVEYGLDIVCDLNGVFSTVLARKKIAMRAGETDRAVTVDSHPFEALAHSLAIAVPHPGSMDVDVIVDTAGNIFVIDINPRFGGGYPFSHIAGANIPNAYVAWASGRQPEEAWMESTAGVLGGKFVETIRIT